MTDPSNKMILCAACNRRHQVGKLDVIVTHYYISPSGCTDGDYWREGEWHFVCAETGIRNRIFFPKAWEEKTHGVDAEGTFKSMFRSAFKSMKNEHEHNPVRSNWCVNTYIDKHRRSFGLPEWVPAVPGRVVMP